MMNRNAVVAAGIIVVSVAAISYGYVEWSERKEAELAAKKAIEARNYAIALRNAELQKQKKLLAEARELLDAWPEKQDALIKAAENLRYLLPRMSGGESARVHIEMARLHLKSGYINYHNYRPGTLNKAEQELQIALRLNGKSADTLVLLGHVYFLKRDFEGAIKTLRQAEQIDMANPWLYLNWADPLIDLGRIDEADEKLQKARAQLSAMRNASKSAMRSLLDKVSTVAEKQGRLDDADKAYQELLALDPRSAWSHGNYAAFLLYRKGLPDAAIAESEKALAIMDYGMGRLVLAAALYAKWAEEKRKNPAQAAQHLERAKSVSTHFEWIMPQLAKSVSAGPAVLNAVRDLMALGVPLDTRDNNKDTGLTLAADNGDAKSVEILIKLGADIEARDRHERTALASAAAKGHIETVKRLVAYRARVDVPDRTGYTPLHAAILGNHEDMIRLLISMKADINSSTGEYSPLMVAAGGGKESIVRILLDAGADPSLKSKAQQMTAADVARKQGHPDLADFIRSAADRKNKRG